MSSYFFTPITAIRKYQPISWTKVLLDSIFETAYIMYAVELIAMMSCMILLVFGIHTYSITGMLVALLLLNGPPVIIFGMSPIVMNSKWHLIIYLIAIPLTLGLIVVIVQFPEILVPLIGASHLHM